MVISNTPAAPRIISLLKQINRSWCLIWIYQPDNFVSFPITIIYLKQFAFTWKYIFTIWCQGCVSSLTLSKSIPQTLTTSPLHKGKMLVADTISWVQQCRGVKNSKISPPPQLEVWLFHYWVPIGTPSLKITLCYIRNPPQHLMKPFSISRAKASTFVWTAWSSYQVLHKGNITFSGDSGQ